MESTTDLNGAAGKVKSRRLLLAGAVGGLAAWLAAAAQRAMPAEASAGRSRAGRPQQQRRRLQHRAPGRYHEAHLPRRPGSAAGMLSAPRRRAGERLWPLPVPRAPACGPTARTTMASSRPPTPVSRSDAEAPIGGEWLRTPHRRESVLRSGPGHGPRAAPGARLRVELSQETTGSPSRWRQIRRGSSQGTTAWGRRRCALNSPPVTSKCSRQKRRLGSTPAGREARPLPAS